MAGAAVLAGCSPSTSGDPKPQTTTSAAPESTGSSVPTVAFPKRPQELKLEGIPDACSVLTTEQQEELGIDNAKPGTQDVVKGKDSPACSFRANSRPLYSYEVALVANEGVGYWEGSGNLDVAQKTVSGYGAYEVRLAGTTTGDCALAIDVAEGQQFFISFFPIGDGFTQEQMCQNVVKGAELALTTLQTLK
ncbi:hypothetical protein GCM10018963_27610 [Saccharothrix longispora]